MAVVQQGCEELPVCNETGVEGVQGVQGVQGVSFVSAFVIERIIFHAQHLVHH